ncbi:MAG: RNA polymerase sigma factor [Lachnospiraceae bacterium]|nr:RNA polymerase sigma factor [Lachnospiraceae bacterium]MBR3683553.1 RNA polymerase sigma factor [Lachnospiraceae bacterium]
MYQTYYMEVYSYVMTIMKDSGWAEEITQETFFKAMRSLDSYRGGASEVTWLCAIAKNLCIDTLRKESRHGNLNDEISSSINIEKTAVDKMTSLQIHQVLHNLDEPYKEVFNLRCFGELAFRDIGQIFGKSENWARVTYHRARLLIQERI